MAHKAVWSPRKTAVRFCGRDISYAELEQRVAHTAGHLRHDRSVGEGDRVAYVGLNSPAILDLFFACARIGAIFVPLNCRLSPPQLGVMLDNADPVCLFIGPGFEAEGREAWGSRNRQAVVHLIDESEPDGTGLSIDSLIDSAPQVPCDPDRDQDVPVLIAYTSGTTGTPKGAVYTQEALTVTAISSNIVHDMRSGDNVLTFLPMFHVGGLLIFTLPAIHVGATVTVHRQFDAGAVLDEIDQTRVTLLLAPPQFSRQLTQHPRFATTDLTSLRCVAIGSTFVPPEIMQDWFDRDVPAMQNYGLTEGVPALSSPRDHARRKADTAGTSVPYLQAGVFDENRVPLPSGERGEIMLRGRSLFSEYWRNPVATADAFHDGWFATGDVAYVDDEGYFHIVDRKKNIVIVGSSNVYPADLERILCEHDGIAEAAVVGVPDEHTGEALVACVRLHDHVSLDADDVRGFFDGRIADYQRPRDVLFVDDFPRTALGKIQRVELATSVAARFA